MALKQRIADDLKAALLGGDRFVTDVLRTLKAAILNEEVAKGKRDEGLDDASIEQIIAKEVKKRLESASMYEQGDRAELADTEKREAAVLKKYLPEQLSEQELEKIVRDTVQELDVSGMVSMGQVMGGVKQKVGNRADGSLLASVVKRVLS